jgi:transcriptional regulator with XRE-family HTH domain
MAGPGERYESERTALLKRFGERFAALRRSSFASQEAFAAASSLHRTQIGKLELGQTEPGLLTLLILADTLGVSVDRLVADVAVPEQRRPQRRARAPGGAAIG